MKLLTPPRRCRGLFPVLGTTTALAFALLLPLPAYAGSDPLPGNVTGADISGPGSEMTGENAERAKEKVALSLEYAKLLDGTTTPAAFAKAERAGNAKLGLTNPRTTVAAKATASRTLKLTHYGQKKGYYCGPATGLMVVRMIDGAVRSRYNKESFTQAHMADKAHMATDANGATRWSSDRFALGIDRWRGEKWYVQVDRPSAKLMKAVLLHSIGGNGKPVAADTVEISGGAHYNNHPKRKQIGHWITAYGYSASGATARWADPATTVWPTVHPTFAASTSTFTTTYLRTNGIAY